MEVETVDRGAAGTAGTAGAVEQDVFADSFREAEGVGDAADLTAADDPAKRKPEEEQPAETTEVVETAGTAGTSGIQEQPVQQPGEPDEKYEQRYKTLQGIHRHDKETWEAEKTTLLTQIEEAKKPKAPEGEKKEPTVEETAAAEKFIDSLTDEQKRELESYEAEFDVVSRMEGLQRAVAIGALRKEIAGWKDEILQKLTATEKTLLPIQTRAEEDERTAHFNAIRNGYIAEDGTQVPGHSDYEKFRDDGSVDAWIGTFPAYLQGGFKKVLSKGTAAEVIDLFDRFKEANNIPSLPEQPVDNVVQLSEKKAQRKAALSAVSGRRGAVNLTQADTSDYEGAFEEASKKVGG